MSFDKKLRPLYDQAIKPGIESAGYNAYLAGETHHTESIDSQILVDIRESAFVVADMTGDNQNVFFEAGFAKGLDRQVIFTVHEDDLNGKHIDTRNFLHVVWATHEELVEKLKYAIIDVMGRGPHPVDD